MPSLHSRIIFCQHKYIWTGSQALFSSLGRELCQQSKASSLSLAFLTVSVCIWFHHVLEQGWVPCLHKVENKG